MNSRGRKTLRTRAVYASPLFSSAECPQYFYTAGHPVHPATRNTQYEYGIDVTIGKNVWIGGNVVICPGVTIGDNSVIGAGSVVTKDIPAWTVAAGNPCRVIRKITEADRNKHFTGREIDDEAWQDILRIEREENDNRKYPVAEE